ncbi:MAG: Rap1a/Tai family immunity protein [Gammaproteobacteria bacterium]|nr:Rap1a/Tai family immunity protein [Gammaproteobacteria bacterium]
MVFIIALVLNTSFIQDAASQSNILKGEDLLRSCEAWLHYEETSSEVDMQHGTSCVLFIFGFREASDMYVALNKESMKWKLCVPSQVSTIQIIKIVVRYLNDRPNVLHMRSAPIVADALKREFPCD